MTSLHTGSCRVAALAAIIAAATGSAFADGVNNYTVRSTNDTFTNSGTIRSTATANGGVAVALAGSRVIAPALAWNFDYRSSGNRYINQGVIESKSTANGGAAYAIAAQEVVR